MNLLHLKLQAIAAIAFAQSQLTTIIVPISVEVLCNFCFSPGMDFPPVFESGSNCSKSQNRPFKTAVSVNHVKAKGSDGQTSNLPHVAPRAAQIRRESRG
jgi:hypothetical protein